MNKALITLALAGGLFAPPGAHAQDEGAQPKIELSHFMSAYSVADIEAVTAFYVDVLDFEVVKDVPLGDAMHFRWLRNGNQGIELVRMANSQPGPERGRPPAHLAVRGPGQLMLQVADLEATKAALLAKGVTPVVDITAIAPLGIKVMFVNDPEGNPIEIVQVTGG
ncbi:MAG TPA: VOC family protein [Croceibacterium sp.]|nr:VOC family protein [Croceibacterium sp.]